MIYENKLSHETRLLLATQGLMPALLPFATNILSEDVTNGINDDH